MISFIKVLRIVLYISLYWSIYLHHVYSSGLALLTLVMESKREALPDLSFTYKLARSS